MSRTIATGAREKSVWYFVLALVGSIALLLALILYKVGIEHGCPGWTNDIVTWLAANNIELLSARQLCEIVATIIDALIHGLVVIVFLELLLKYRESRHVEETINTTLQSLLGGADVPIFKGLALKTKQLMVHGSLRDTLGEEYGDVFFEQIVSPYMEREVSYRENFRYDVECFNSAPNTAAEYRATERAFLASVAREHIWLKQDMQYTRHGTHQDQKLPHLFARFAFSQLQLTRFITTDGLFFREVMRIPDDARKLLFELDDQADELDHFVRSVFGFRAYSIIEHRALDFHVSWEVENATSERYLEIRIDNPSGNYEGSGCRIEFVLPHHHLETEFLVTLPQPVKPEANISFKKCEGMRSLSYIPFISTFRSNNFEPTFEPKDNRTNPTKVSIKIRGWTFPTGGLVFVWKPEGVESKSLSASVAGVPPE